MPLYRLTDEQAKQLRVVLANAQIRGAEAPMIITLSQALMRAIPETKPEPPKKEDGKK